MKFALKNTTKFHITFPKHTPQHKKAAKVVLSSCLHKEQQVLLDRQLP